MKVLHVQFPAAPDQRDGLLISAAMREARHRAGRSQLGFTVAVGGIGPAAVAAYESGVNVPPADAFLHALELGGLDLRSVIEDWLNASLAG